LRPAVQVTGPRPLRLVVRRTGTAHDPPPMVSPRQITRKSSAQRMPPIMVTGRVRDSESSGIQRIKARGFRRKAIHRSAPQPDVARSGFRYSGRMGDDIFGTAIEGA
jgi:hypothetical protein